MSRSTTPPDAGTARGLIGDYDDLAARLAAVPGVTRAAPLIRGQVMASANGRASGVEVIGTRLEDLQAVPLVARPETAAGELARLRRASPSARASRASSGWGSAT